MYEVRTIEDAEKLAAYEGLSYTSITCSIQYSDGQSPTQAEGYAFLFVGHMRDLREGSFDLKIWLERNGRRGVGSSFGVRD